MDDYINRSNVIDRIERHYRRIEDEIYQLSEEDKIFNWGLDVAIDIANNEPAADVRENVRAEWVNYSEYDTSVIQRFNRWVCSNCGNVRKRGWEQTSDGNKPLAKFCENCGAYMRGGDKDG